MSSSELALNIYSKSREEQLVDGYHVALAEKQLMEAVKRLAENVDFQRVIMKSFMVDMVLERTHQLSFSMVDEKLEKHLHAEIKAPNFLKKYLENLVRKGEEAESRINEFVASQRAEVVND